MWSLYAIIVGCLLDLLLGDPHRISFIHPVVLIGKLISVLEKLVRRIFPKTTRGENLAGAVLWILVVSISTAIPAALLRSGSADRVITENEKAVVLDCISTAFTDPYTMPEGFAN